MNIQKAAKKIMHGINVCVAGDGVPVVLLPGWPQTAEAYSEILPSLSQQYQVWAVDLPGLGDSAPSTKGYDTMAISQILEESLRTAMPDKKYHLVGHDVGAWVAYSWAAQFPASIKSLTVLDSAIPGMASPLSFPLTDEVNVKLWQFAFNRLSDLPEILTNGKERELLDWLFDAKAEHPDRISKEKRNKYVECYSKAGGMSRGFAYYRAVTSSAQQNLALASKKLSMPVLAIGGKSGAGMGMKNCMVRLADDVQGGEIESCGHYIMEEQPEIVARMMLDFWRSI
jgi:pimeloyl-ACP methyl ester carboxylesterase